MREQSTPSPVGKRVSSKWHTLDTPPHKRAGKQQGPSLEKLTILIGLGFLVMNLLVIAYWLPGSHHQHVDRLVHPHPAEVRRKALRKEPHVLSTPTAPKPNSASAAALSERMRRPLPLPSTVRRASSAPSDTFVQWLEQCAQQPRCACLQHGVGPDSVELFAAFPQVAFFVLTGDERLDAAKAVGARVRDKGLGNVHILWLPLGQQGTQPMANDVLNPRGRHVTALQALQTSNEFFDLQLVHTR